MKFRVIEKLEWNEIGNSVDLCQLPFSVLDLESKFNVVFFEYVEDGLGNLYGSYIEIEGFKMYLQGSQPKDSNEYGVLVMIRSTEEFPFKLLKVLCQYFQLTVNDLMWVMENLSPPSWLLYRVDDNGNEIEMFKFINESSAHCLMNEYEVKDHKQSYFVRRL